MTQTELQRVKRAFERVRMILHGEWDPIGAGAPLDEYDSYCWPVLALLQRRAPRRELETYLLWAADEQMRCPVPESRLASVLDQLTALDVS